MPTFQRFEEIEGWRRARELTGEVYAVSGKGAFAKDFGLRDQIRRAAVSVVSNIAEGCERSGRGEFVQTFRHHHMTQPERQPALWRKLLVGLTVQAGSPQHNLARSLVLQASCLPEVPLRWY